MQPSYLYLSNQPSHNNKRIISFLQKNITRIIAGSHGKGGMSIDFNIINANDIDKLKGVGVEKFPTLIIGKNTKMAPHIVGVMAIEDAFNKIINPLSSASSASSVNFQDGDAAIEDFQRAALGPIVHGLDGKIKINDDNDDNEEDNFAKTLNIKIQQEMSNRKQRNPSFGKGLDDPMDKIAKKNTERADNIIHAPVRVSQARSGIRANQTLEDAGSTRNAMKNMQSGDQDNDMLAKFLDNQEVTNI